MTYQIRNWHKHYENCETKRYTHLRWVPVPNQHDGKYWGRLWQLKNAPEAFAAFILMLELASKMPERGILADEDGELSTGDMAIKTGAPQRIFDLAIPILCDIKWIEPAATLQQDCNTNRIELNRIELNTPKKPPKKEPTGVREILTYFQSVSKDLLGVEYIPDYAKDGAILKRVLSFITTDEAKLLIDQFLSSKDPFIVKAGYTIPIFKTQINKLRQQRPEQKPQPRKL